MAGSRTIRVPVALERDEGGVWCASAALRPGVTAYGDGETREAALDDLREGLLGLIEEFGVPDEELSLTVPTAA
jgi:predicted RNase H-like HicB family nuclease